MISKLYVNLPSKREQTTQDIERMIEPGKKLPTILPSCGAVTIRKQAGSIFSINMSHVRKKENDQWSPWGVLHLH